MPVKSIVYTAQPKQIVVSLNTTGEVANVNTMPDAAHPNKTGDQVEVRLDQSVGVHCVATGGNPQPTVNFSSGNVQYDGVKVTAMTERDSFDMMSEPRHVVTASLVWTPKVSEIAIPFVCTTGSAETKVISASFVPIVADSKLYSYYSYSYFIEFTHQTCMKKVHDNVHKRYSDKTMLTIKTKLLKIE